MLILASCSNFQRMLKSSDMEAKYNAAVKYYDQKDYYHALQLFEELNTVFRGTAKAEQCYYYYCYSTYYVDDYQVAAYHFNNFVQSYPNSKYAQEMQFMHAYCYYLDSPLNSLDQTSTIDAIEKFQLFINKFPSSDRVPEANRLIDELRLKLETKAFNNAKLYYKIGEYKAAVVAFDNLLKDYPSGNYKEEAEFTSLKASYMYASNSIESKKNERFQATLDLYYRFVDNFPQSHYLREAERIFENVKEATGAAKTSSVAVPTP